MSATQSNGKAVPSDAGSDIGPQPNTDTVEGNGLVACDIEKGRDCSVDLGSKRGDAELATDHAFTNGSCTERLIASDGNTESKTAENNLLTCVVEVDCECSVELGSKKSDSEIATDHALTNGFCSESLSTDPDGSASPKEAKDNILTHVDGVCNGCLLPGKAKVVLVLPNGVLSDGMEGAGLGQDVCPVYGEGVELASPFDDAEDTDVASGYETPTEGLYDPFAPGPEELACAPKKRMSAVARVHLRRQLKFDSPGNESEYSAEDHKASEELYTIVPENAEEKLSEDRSLTEPVTSDEPTTPTELPLLTGVADTCPAAPLRDMLKSRKIDPTICRKLNFSC